MPSPLRSSWPFRVLGVLLLEFLAPGFSCAAPTLDFPDDVRVLLQTKCVRCHGAKVRRGDLDLRTPAAALAGGESGPAVLPGKPDTSLLHEKIHSGTMPPGKKNHLQEAEILAVRRWIAGLATTGPKTAAPPPNQHDILPILLRRCTVCHGAHRKEGGLDLRGKAAMLRGGKSGPALVPGKPEQSRLLQKVNAGQMPPRDRLVEVSIKPIEPAEIETLTRWVAAGAPEVDLQPDVASTTPDPLVSDRDRDFWAFRTPKPQPVPEVRHRDRVRNPIDAFLLRKLQEKGLSFSPEADRATLLRRVTFDLTGLPPTPEEKAFLADATPDAYEKVVDRLLASPRHGERWGRFWLDLAGYADSEGKREQDLPRPHAWRYRDYVIRSLNADKPFSRFLQEQIAGDELADGEHAAEITPELYDNLVATGFLRMTPDATWANITGYVPDRLEVISDEIDVFASGVLGLTLKCARCHNHKFDPIPQRDYYRLVDVFKGALDEYDWLKPDVRPGLGPVSVDTLPGRHLPYVTTAERQTWERDSRRRGAPEPRIQALWDRGNPSPTYISRRGDPLSPGRLVGPGVPSVLTDGQTPFEVKPPWPGAQKTGRRLALASWLTCPDHPLTARVAVNRIWKHHFGSGIVKTLGNFGKAGTPPTHPELLDWLAREFVSRGWSAKVMHRLMVTSSAYRQSSALSPELARADPDNALCSRMPLTRLDAEALYDALLLVAGQLDEKPFGPADPVVARPDGLITPARTVRGRRRLVYVRQARKQLPTHLETFDYPQMNPNCLERRDSTVAPQALHLLNNGMVQELARHLAARVQVEATDESRVERVYWIALGRPPDSEERALGIEALHTLASKWAASGKGRAERPRRNAGVGGGAEARLEALVSFCHAVVNSAGFLYVD